MVRPGIPAVLLVLGLIEARGADDALLQLLAQGAAARREEIESLLKARGGDPCSTLSGYALVRDATARERAVRGLGEIGCRDVEHYRPYFSDADAWVADALLDSLARNRVGEAVPYAIDRLSDRRRLVSDAGSWTLSEAAHGSLRTLTAQPIPPPRVGRSADPAAAWRAWYDAHRDRPPASWIASGLESVRLALAGDDAERRLEALETAAAVGEPAETLLQEALRRAPSDLVVTLSCDPDEPPRVGDQVACTLMVRNVSRRRVALAAGEIATVVSPWAPEPGPAPASPPRRGSAAPPSRTKETKAKTGAAPPAVARPLDARRLRGHFVDLGPGDSLRRTLSVGPVQTAGRYEVNTRLVDLQSGPRKEDFASSDAPPIEASVILRFEQ